jgi:ACS family sodium-dependent inorganic phosphate cotransporter
MMKAASDAPTALILLCSACAAHACTWSGFVVNHLDIAPRYADVLMGITNTAGSIPGAVGVALTGWLVQRSGSYASAFALAAGLNLVGAVVWLVFATGKRVLD